MNGSTVRRLKIELLGLVDGEILRRPDFDIQRSLANVDHHANNLPHGPRLSLLIGNPLADWVFLLRLPAMKCHFLFQFAEEPPAAKQKREFFHESEEFI